MATKVIITASENGLALSRTGTVTFTNSDGLTAMVTVRQPGNTVSETNTLTINLLTDVDVSLTLTVDGVQSGGLTSISYGNPYVGEFAHGAVVGWRITPTISSGGPEYDSAKGEVTMDSDQTVNVELRQKAEN